MQNKYIREITLAEIIKTVRINGGLFSLLFVLSLALSFAMLMVSNHHQKLNYKVSGTIQVNNFILAGNNNPDLQMSQYASFNPVTSVLASQDIASTSQTITTLLSSKYVLQQIITDNNLDIKWHSLANPLWSWLDKPLISPLEIKIFTVEASEYNRQFIIEFLTANTYKIATQNEVELGVGKINTQLNLPELSVLITSPQLPGSKFSVCKETLDLAIDNLNKSLEISPLLLIDQKYNQADTGIINITMLGNNPTKQAQLVNNIIRVIQQKTQEQQQRSLTASLQFLDKQIKSTLRELLSAQNQLVKFQTTANIINLDEKASRNLAMLTDLDTKILEKQITIDQFKNLYTAQHPLMQGLEKQKASLIAQKKEYEKELSQMPKNDAIYANIKRNLDVNQQLYVYLTTKQQNLQIQYASTVSPVTILNYASKDVAPIIKPVSTRLIAVIFIGLLVGEIFIIIFFAFANTGDPFLFARRLNVKLLGVIPFLEPSESKQITTNHSELVEVNNRQIFIHSTINAITSYLLSLSNYSAMVVNIGGISNGSGKSFIISAIIKQLSLINKRTLQIKFGLTSDFILLPQLLTDLDNYLPDYAVENDLQLLKINTMSALDGDYFMILLGHLKGFDFIFIESPPIADSPLFMTLTKIINETILLTTPKDTNAQIGIVNSTLF